MQDEAHVTELLPGFALGSLDDADAGLVASHLAACTLCRAELETFQEVVESLALTAPEASPSPGAKRLLLDRVEGLPARRPARPQPVRPRFVQRLLPAWGVISLVLVVVLAAANLLLWQQASSREVFTGPRGMRAIALTSHPSVAPKGSGFVIISADGQNGVVVVDSLPQLDPSQQYQVWLLRDGYATRGPAFNVDETGYRGAWIKAPDPLISYTDILLTIEPVDSAGETATGDEVLSGSLHNR